MLPIRPRIEGFSYVGLHRYSLIICTSNRKHVFCDGEIVARVLAMIRQCAVANEFAILAYCFMPDHVHLVVSALADASDVRIFMSRWKQRSGYEHRQRTGTHLWQPSYFDHVLRDDEETGRAVKYVLENPVRAKLATGFADYRFSGSDVFSTEELRGFWNGQG